MIDTLSTFNVKLAKLLGHSPFPHASQHMVWLSSCFGMSYVFLNQTHVSSADEALWNVAPGSKTLGVLHLAAACSVGPSLGWTPALDGLALKINSDLKVCKPSMVYRFRWS